MRLKSLLIVPLLILSIAEVEAQRIDSIALAGTYGAYLDYSTFTELILSSDGTFRYIDQSELSGSFVHKGSWSVNGSRLLLHTDNNNALRPMPLTWKIKANALYSRKVYRIGGRKHRIMLSRKRDS